MLSLNSFLLSLAFNLALLLALSLCREHAALQSKDAVSVDFVSLPRTRLMRRSVILPPRFHSPNTQHTPSDRISVRITAEIASSRSDSAIPIGIDTADGLDTLSPAAFERGAAASSTMSTGAWKRGNGTSTRPAGTGGRSGQIARRITPRQSRAIITGSGDALKGYYNISLVRYEDTSDVISADALAQLAGAMNVWTQVKTKVIKEPMMLDDPELLRMPLVYITSRRAFAFSEKERRNLQRYFAAGGFLLFSNAADSESEARGVANSIEFELWKVLGQGDPADIEKKHQVYGSFFDLPDSLNLRGIALNDRISVIYEDSGYGVAWRAGKDSKREPYMKLGVNIIAYALTTSPMAQQD
jgi:hypothetical protein